jgi:hypothetical protein
MEVTNLLYIALGGEKEYKAAIRLSQNAQSNHNRQDAKYCLRQRADVCDFCFRDA